MVDPSGASFGEFAGEDLFRELDSLSRESSDSAYRVFYHSTSLGSRLVSWNKKRKGELPDWAVQHIRNHCRLQNSMIQCMNENRPIPENLISRFKRSDAAMAFIANKMSYSAFFEEFNQNKGVEGFHDPGLMLKPVQDGHRTKNTELREWKINCGLLYDAYQRTNDEHTKEQIRFLITNYLQKAAYLNSLPGVNLSEEDTKHYQEMVQIGQVAFGGMYHRTADSQIGIARLIGADKMIGREFRGHQGIIPVDSIEVDQLYATGFQVMPPLSETGRAVDFLVEKFKESRENYPAGQLRFPFLVDVSAEIGDSLITNGNPEKHAEFAAHEALVRERLLDISSLAAERIAKDLSAENLDPNEVSDFLKANTAVVSKARVTEKFGVLYMHDTVFEAEDFQNPALYRERDISLSLKMKEWAGCSAVGIGAVNFRRIVAESCKDIEDLSKFGGEIVNYAVPGKTDVVFFTRPEDVLRTNSFEMLRKLGAWESLSAQMGEDTETGHAQALLARTTARMVQTLLESIADEDWQEKQADPIVRELTQLALHRLTIHMGDAVQSRGNFREFSQAIDRMHAELTTIMVFYAPFAEEVFEENYRQMIQPLFPTVTKEVEGHEVSVQMEPRHVGVARSAMNVFSGVNAAIMQNNQKPVRVCGEHSYYEESSLVGSNLTLDAVIADPNVEKVDLYVTEFNHNIDIDPNHTNYQRGTPIEDIRRIFTEKPATDSLTVAIDATIDLVDSLDVEDLFNEFKDEIDAGRLNVVVFRSGQKFDMLGLDNYYGAPFYVVNNGDAKWRSFDTLKTDEVFQTDELSRQYFSWMAQAGPAQVDEYKRMIFTNTRAILYAVPNNLRPGPGKSVCVCSFDEDVKTPFIDIKIDHPDPDKKNELQQWVRQRFFEMFLSEDRLVYARGSFGFPHPNITWIDPKMRINPGLDPEEIRLYAQFFKELEAKLEQMGAQ